MSPFNLNMVSSVLTSYVTFLLGLIEGRDWTRFEECALSNPRFFESISNAIGRMDEFNGMTLLHACARYDAPADLLERMIEFYPPALRQEDCMGRTPLHVAAGTGADARAIGLLAIKYPRACEIQDEDGRTPLHHACDSSCDLFEGDESLPTCQPVLDTIQVLLVASPESVILEDGEEMNALEYAILSDAPGEVVDLLLRASQLINKKKSEMMDKASPSRMHRSLSASYFC